MLNTKYAHNGDVHIAYQVVGDGPIDLVYIPGWVSHVEAAWSVPRYAWFLEQLASFSRLIVMDKRGTGASDRAVTSLALDDQMHDLVAVLDAVGSERAAIFGAQEGGAIGILHAATFPERTQALITFGTAPRYMQDEDYPWGVTPETLSFMIGLVEQAWEDLTSNEQLAIAFNPSFADDRDTLQGMLRLARFAGSPATSRALMEMYTAIDLRPVLPTISVPTLALHRETDSQTPPQHSQYIADNVSGGKYVALQGADWFLPAGDLDVLLEEIQLFLTGSLTVKVPDRSLMTLLYTDIVDSTKQSAEVGDRAWGELMDHHDRIARLHLDRFGGRMVRHRGDGILAAFDGPGRAISCATAIRDSVAGLGIEVRVGMHTGEVETRADNDLTGMTMNIGARVMEAAGPSEILVSSTVRDLVPGSGVVFEDRGPRSFKGVPDDWHLYAVVA